jgi:lysyl-tRNA synthetase class I
MSDIQRFDAGLVTPDPEGDCVTYADHVEALRQARDEGYEYGYNSNDTAYMEGFHKGHRDALAGAVQRVEALERFQGGRAQSSDLEDVIAAIKGDSDE